MKIEKKTGIRFDVRHGKGKNNSSKHRATPEKSGQDILLYPFVCLLVIGTVLMMTVPFGFVINEAAVVVSTAVTTACFFAVFKYPIRWYWTILGFHLLFGWGVWEFREQLFESTQLYIYRVTDMVTAYYVRNEYYIIWNKTMPSLLPIFMVVWFGFWISLSVLRLRKPLPVLIPGGVIFVGLLAIGAIAGSVEFMCVLIGGIGIAALLWNQTKVNVAAMVSILLIGALVLQTLITALIPVPGAAARKAGRKQIETIFDEYSLLPGARNSENGNGGFSSSGLSGGDLSDMGDRRYSGVKKVKVTVTAKPDTPIYLKGYAGDVYQDYQWVPDENNAIDDMVLANIPYFVLAQEYIESEMIIEVIDSFGDFTLVPYSAYVKESNEAYILGDYTVTGYQYFNEIYSLGTNVKDISIPLELYGVMELEAEYAGNVYELELNVPEELTKLYSDSGLIMEEPADDYSAVVQFVQQELAERADYTLSPGTTPAGEDPIEYFLYNNQKGYCMHFASAGVLMFRLNGIPARFAEGFVINPSEFHETEEGIFEASVEDYQAHAWVEIYIDKFGWIPIEVTPGYQGGTNAAQNETEEQEEEVETPEEVNEEENQQQKTEKPEENSQGFKDQSILQIGLAGVGIIVLTAVILQSRKYYYRRKRYSKLHDEDSDQAVINAFQYIKEMLAYGGMPEGQFHQSSEYVWLWDLAYKAAYSREMVSKEEWLKCYQLYLQVRSEVHEKQSWFKRLVFTYVKCF